MYLMVSKSLCPFASLDAEGELSKIHLETGHFLQEHKDHTTLGG